MPERESEYTTSSAPGVVAKASPKLATSTPSSLSLVERSAPVNGLLTSPASCWATVMAISYPGATRP